MIQHMHTHTHTQINIIRVAMFSGGFFLQNSMYTLFVEKGRGVLG